MTCPECGGVNSGVVNTSHDAEGHKIRARDCHDCGKRYNTVEVAHPFSFHEADEGKRQAPAYSSRIKTPEYEPAYFEMETGRLVRRWRNRKGRATVMFRAFEADPDGDVVMVKLCRSSKYPRCRSGLHVMRGANVYHHPAGHKVCNACRRAASNARNRRAA